MMVITMLMMMIVFMYALRESSLTFFVFCLLFASDLFFFFSFFPFPHFFACQEFLFSHVIFFIICITPMPVWAHRRYYLMMKNVRMRCSRNMKRGHAWGRRPLIKMRWWDGRNFLLDPVDDSICDDPHRFYNLHIIILSEDIAVRALSPSNTTFTGNWRAVPTPAPSLSIPIPIVLWGHW